MRFTLRFLPAFLCLLAPLAVLAWLGSLEFSRLEERAERALRDQAFLLLEGAGRRFDDAVRLHEALLERPLDLRRGQLVATAAEFANQRLAVRDLVIFDAEGRLVFPRPPPRGGDLPFGNSAGPVSPAEWMIGIGDFVGARSELEALLERPSRWLPPEPRGRGRSRSGDRPNSNRYRLRARFLLASVLRKTGDLDAAVTAYGEARSDAESSMSERAGRFGLQGAEAEAAACVLLCDTALAEIAAVRTGNSDAATQVVRDISEGRHDDVTDSLSQAIALRLAQRVPPDSAARLALDSALELDEVRRNGRQFALEFRSLVAETMRRRLRRPDVETPVYQAFAGLDGCSLLLLRQSLPQEEAALAEYGGAWVGLRVDVSFLASDVLDEQLASEQGLTLAILDPDGVPVLADPATADIEPAATAVASHTALGGLRLLAIPSAPGAVLAERQATFRNRALLVLALCLLAGVGAFFLLRSVARESELATLKIDLVSRVSHELRTPLSLIKMYGETLSLGRARDQQQSLRFASIISREADRLTALIQRILDFSSQQAGQFTYQKEGVDASRLLQVTTEDYRPHVEAAAARIDADIEPGLHLHADPGALASAYVNLLENAVKYTPATAADRSIEVELRRDGDSARLEVRDRGVGVPERERRRIFDSFYRASTAGEIRGAGLGLSLVQHFVTAHGGTIKAIPRTDGGTIFRLRLPLVTASAASTTAPETTP